MPRTNPVAAVKKPSAARKTTEPTRLASRYWPRWLGRGTSSATTRPAVAVSSARIGVYTLHLSGDLPRSRAVDRPPTTKPPSGPKTTAEKTSGRNATDISVRPPIATVCRSATAAIAPRTKSAHRCGSRYPLSQSAATMPIDSAARTNAQATDRRSALSRLLTSRSSLAYPPKGV